MSVGRSRGFRQQGQHIEPGKYHPEEWEGYRRYWEAFRAVLAQVDESLSGFAIRRAAGKHSHYWIEIGGTAGRLRGAVGLAEGHVGLNFMTADEAAAKQILAANLTDYEYTPVRYARTGRLFKSAEFQRKIAANARKEEDWPRQHMWLAKAIFKAFADFRQWAK